MGVEGRSLWRSVVARFELDEREVVILAAACRCVDRAGELDQLVAVEGVTVAGSSGQPRLHPGVAEARNQRVAMGRLLGQLALPDAGGDVVQARTSTSLRASRAARARWDDGAAETG